MSLSSIRNFFQNQQWNGTWNLPRDADRKYPGRLVVNAKGPATLSLHPGIPHFEQTPLPDGGMELTRTEGSWHCLHGRAGAKDISLFDVRVERERSDWSSSDEGPFEQESSARDVLIGIHHDSTENPLSPTISMRIENATKWVNVGVLSVDAVREPEGAVSDQISCKKPFEVTDSESEVSLKVSKRSHWKGFATPEGERFEVSSDTVITLVSQTDLSIAEMRDLIWQVQELFAALIYRAPRVLSVTFPNPFKPLGSEVLFYTQTRNSEISCKDSESLTYLCDFQLDGLLSRWLTERKKNPSTYNVYFGMKFSDNQFLESKVVAYVSSLESLSLNENIQFRDYAGRKKGKTTTLKDRLWGLVLRLPLTLRSLIVPNPAVFTEEAKNARHGISHTGESPLPAEDLYGVVCTIDLLLTAHLLLRLGISADTLRERLIDYGPTRHKISYIRNQYLLKYFDER